MNRVDRLVGILTTLQSNRNISAESIARKYDISVRTVFRDLKALGEIGVPIHFDKSKGYSIVQGYFLPPISLSLDEANALSLMASLAQKFSDQTTQMHVENALNKIKAVLRSSDREDVNFLQSQIRIYQAPGSTQPADYLAILQQAIVKKQRLKISYTNNHQEHSKREIEPIGLTFYSNQWHLIAWCWLREDYRDFKVACIETMLELNELFRKDNHYDVNEYIQSISKNK